MGARNRRSGFTLIELSIVLVVIGLIAGGILVGRDLISAAQVRAQVTQIEKYNQAANTFYGKYGYLPGDISDPSAQLFGFAARGGVAGQGDGTGVIEGNGCMPCGPGHGSGQSVGDGETGTFWVDLSTAHLIEGGFSTASPTVQLPDTTGIGLDAIFPRAKISPNHIHVWSGGCTLSDSINYFALSNILGMYTGWADGVDAYPGLTVSQAYAIDMKIDDGLPQSGRVQALYEYLHGNCPARTYSSGPGYAGVLPGGQAAATTTTCYDNGNVAGATMQYSVTQNGGNGTNCALSFKFQ